MNGLKPNKQGQLVKFHVAKEDDIPEQLYMVLEVIDDNEKFRVNIQALNTGLAFFLQ